MNYEPSTMNFPNGFHFPAEWAKHTATWLSWPHKEESWPGKIDLIYPKYCEFIKVVSEGELVRTNDAWCRDHGPAFLIKPQTKRKAIVDWSYNAWGNKYPPFDLDDVIPTN